MVLLATGQLAACDHTAETPAGPVDQFVATEEWRLGGSEALRRGLASIDGITIMPSGDLFAVDLTSRRIAKLDSLGRDLIAFGQQGTGPGDFMTPAMLGHIADTLWVNDIRLRRISLFDLDGRLLRTISASLGLEGVSGKNRIGMGLLDDGALLATYAVRSREMVTFEPMSISVSRYDTQSTNAVEFGRIDPPRIWRFVDEARGMRSGAIQPLIGSAFYAVAQNGSRLVFVEQPVPTGRGDAYFHLRQVASDGRVLFSRRYRYEPQEVSQGLVDSLIAVQTRNRRASPAAVRDSLMVPTYLFPVATALVGRDGTIWIRREAFGAAATWELYDSEGNLVGRVKLPPDARVVEGSRERAWILAPDPDGVSQLSRIRLDPARIAADY